MLWLHEASDSCNNPVSLGVQVSIRRKFDGLKHGGRLVLHNLLQLDTQAQMLTACARVHCSESAAIKFADGLLK